MSDPNSGLRWLLVAACCWPSPLALLGGFLLASALQRGWLNIHIDRSKAPRFNWRRNDR